MVNHYSFYTAFSTAEEYVIVHGSKKLGTLPIDYPLFDGAYLIFAGRRWQVVNVNMERRIVEVTPALGGRPPAFGGSVVLMHEVVVQEMRKVYENTDIPAFVDLTGRDLLDEGRYNFRRYELEKRWLLPIGNDTLIFLWRGSSVMNTLAALLMSGGFKVSQEGIALHVVGASEDRVGDFLKEKLAGDPPSPIDLATHVANKLTEKHDRFLSEELLRAEYAVRHFDADSTWKVMKSWLPN
jgi:ATP-dependent Lhr-like helicase